MNPDGLPYLDLFRFDTAEDVQRFELSTDRVMGGNTICSFGVKERRGLRRGVFEGIIDYDDPFDHSPLSQAGYASIRTKPNEHRRFLRTFSALEMRVRTDGRSYIVILKCDGENRPETYQWCVKNEALMSQQRSGCKTTAPFSCWSRGSELLVEGGRWATVAAPFSEFVKASRGYVHLSQTSQSRGARLSGEAAFKGVDPTRIRSFGILLADGLNGPFRLEVQYIRAVRQFDEENFRVRLPPGTSRLRRRRLGGGSRPRPLPER